MIDDINKQIILLLQQDGRESYTEMAERLGMVEGTIRRRLRQLKQKNIIRVTAAPNLAKLGYGFTSIMGMQLKMENLREVAEKLA